MAGTVRTTGKKPTSEKDPKIAGEGNLSTGGTRAARAARAKKEQNSNSSNNSKSLNDITNGVKEAAESVAAKKSSANKNTSSKSSSEDIKSKEKQNESTKETTTTVDPEKVLKQLEEATKKIEELSKINQNLRSYNSILRESIKQRAEEDAKKSQETSKEEPQVNNSETTEETVAPESEPKANTEQAQTTQEPAKDANATAGTGEATADNMMTPEDAYNYFKNKDNYEKASNVFETPSFNEYIDSTTGKWIPRGYFDAYNAKDGINPKKFTFEQFKAKIPEDLSKKLTSAEATEELAKRNAALKSYDEEYKKYNSGFQAYLRKHPKLANALKWGTFGALGEGAVEFGKWLNETYMAGQNDKDELQDIMDSLNDDEPEYPGLSSGNNSPEDIAAQLKGADEFTETPEGDSGNIEQVIKEQAPANNVVPENTQVAANAATPTGTATNNVPASTAEPTKPAPTQGTQGLPPVVVNNTPPTNVGSNGMTTSQLVEALAPQAGSDAYGDLYDQNFIDFWAKRNPNLAFGVSQGRR